MTSETPVLNEPKSIQCPTCLVPAGEACTQPTNTGRRAVSWVHDARRDATAWVPRG